MSWLASTGTLGTESGTSQIEIIRVRDVEAGHYDCVPFVPFVLLKNYLII